MRRPLAITSLVFVMVLFLLQMGNTFGIIKKPIVYRADELSVLNPYRQGDTVVVCGRIADYSINAKNGKTTTELNLKNIQIMPRHEDNTKDNISTNHLSESDYVSKLQKIDTGRQRILVYLQEKFMPTIGSYVIVSGQMSYFDKATNPGEFDAYRFYTNRGFLFAVKRANILKTTASGNCLLQNLKEFRLRQEAYLERYLPDGNDAVMKAMLFGNKKEMDEETKELYQKNGIAHILAISGVNTLNLVSLSKSQMPNLRAFPQVLLRKFTLFYQQFLSGFCPLVVLPLFRGCFSKLTKWQKKYLFAKV